MAEEAFASNEQRVTCLKFSEVEKAILTECVVLRVVTAHRYVNCQARGELKSGSQVTE